MHVCKAVCCKLKFALTSDEIEVGLVKWDIGHPYIIRQSSTGYCCHNDPETRGCGIYDDRPSLCRRFSCKGDDRIWTDFDNMIINQEWIDQHVGRSDAILLVDASPPDHPDVPTLRKARSPSRRRRSRDQPRLSMIDDVDEAVRTLIRQEALNGTAVDVVFDAPTKEWSSRRNSPTLDVYLYDISEDLRRRETGVIDVHNDEGRITGRRRPPRHFKLSYLVTAWTQRPEDEHRLLSAVLACFVRHDKLPAEVLQGSLADQPLPVRVTVGLPPPEDRALSDVWSAMGGELKPSLDLVITLPVDTLTFVPAATLVTEQPRFTVSSSEGGSNSARVVSQVVIRQDRRARLGRARLGRARLHRLVTPRMPRHPVPDRGGERAKQPSPRLKPGGGRRGGGRGGGSRGGGDRIRRWPGRDR